MAVLSHKAVVPALEAVKATISSPLVGGIMPSQPEMTESFYEDTENATNNDNTDDEHEESEEEDGSFWDAVSTWYLPLLILWLRRSMFGTANLVRSLIVGQCLRLFLTGDVPKWAQPFTDPHAWPPPAFTVLAILTVVAFVVHPDGLTWFMLGKLRDAILSLLHSFASCWTMFIQDYGIITTTIALMTLAGIGCLLGILLKNALPKAYSAGCPSQTSDKKKKKRKGVKGKGGRIRQFRSAPAATPPTKPIPETETEASLQQHDDAIIKPQEPKDVHQQKERVKVAEPPALIPDYHPTTTGMSTSRFSAVDTISEFTETTTAIRTRGRVQSSSTVDTLVDDVSCDSTSVLSFASAPTAVTVGSTEKSESEVSVPVRSKRQEKNRRKQQQTTEKQNKRGDRKNATSDGADRPPQHPQRKLSPKPAASRLREDSRYANQVTKPPTTGRFANLKEKDRRFDNPRRNQAHGRGNGARGKNQGAGRGYNTKHSTPTPLPVPVPVKPIINTAPVRTQQRPVISTTTNPGSTVQFGSPYSSSPDRQCLKKQELTSTLARVGLVGNDAASIVTNVADVDSLARLSDVQYQLYGVSTEKQEKLNGILEERHGRRNIIRPPPGLSPIVHDEPPTLFGSANRGSPPVDLAAKLGPPTFQMYAYDENQYVGFMNDEDSRIEAELQELGGKMIGSILDF